MNVKIISCDKTFRCWECSKNCDVKKLFSVSNEEFLACLHNMYSMNAGYMLTRGYSLKEVEDAQKIVTLTLYTSRMKYLQNQ